jgi:spore germination protein
VPYWDQDRAFEEVDRHGQHLTVVSPWWYAPADDGSVVTQHDGFTDVDLDRVRELQRAGYAVVPTIANHRDGHWDFEVVGRILADPDRTARHVAAVTDLVLEHGYDGIQLDYENLDAADTGSYAELVRELAAALHEHDRTLAVAVNAKVDATRAGWAAGHDYELLGRYADELHLMAYDLHNEGSDPGPIAPTWWVERVVRHATSVVPPEKLVLGIGLFGYDWGRRGHRRRPHALGGRRAHARPRRCAAVRPPQPFTGVHLRGRGDDRELWFEDARSVRHKLRLVDRYDLAGVFYWRLGGTTAEIWRAVGTWQALRAAHCVRPR